MVNKKEAYIIDSFLKFDRQKKHVLMSIAGNADNLLDLSKGVVKEVLTENEIDEYEKLKHINIEERWLELTNRNINFTYYGADDYPEKLLNIPDPPFGLYFIGELPNKNSRNVAIIGARQNSDYGNYMAKTFAKVLAQNNINVISGMALGIDGISQREAIFAGGKSYGVLGCGVDVIYPRSNKNLYLDLTKKGGVISEYQPGVAALPYLFPPRNRIISGLADCILVVEAREKSGTLITVDMALEQGKDVFVIPGRCTDSLSYGCNKLIRNGAICTCSPEELLNDMNWKSENISEKKETKTKKLSETAKNIFDVLDFNPKSQDEVLNLLQKNGKTLSIPELSKGLLELELYGIIHKNFGQYSVISKGF